MELRNVKDRRGQTLILFILFLLGLVGILALTLDFGFVLLSRRTMQTAVNSAALEGARNFDQRGRREAREVIQNVFDDDMDPSDNPTTLGAGPKQTLVQRDGSDRARLGEGTDDSELFGDRFQYVYHPAPELNTDNEIHGDLVAGDYQETASHAESSDYQRQDFVPSIQGQAFLARIRRTPDRVGVATSLDRVEGTSSSGDGSPLLMGQLMPFTPNSAGGRDIRRDGVTIRATAIADNRPIVYVGSAIHADLFSATPYGKYADSAEFRELDSTPRCLGEMVSAGATVDQQNVPTGYVAALYNYNGNDYVVGFMLHISATDTEARKPNASPRLHDAMQRLNELSPEVRDAVLARHRELSHEENSVLARLPVLVRAVR